MRKNLTFPTATVLLVLCKVWTGSVWLRITHLHSHRRLCLAYWVLFNPYTLWIDSLLRLDGNSVIEPPNASNQESRACLYESSRVPALNTFLASSALRRMLSPRLVPPPFNVSIVYPEDPVDILDWPVRTGKSAYSRAWGRLHSLLGLSGVPVYPQNANLEQQLATLFHEERSMGMMVRRLSIPVIVFQGFLVQSFVLTKVFGENVMRSRRKRLHA